MGGVGNFSKHLGGYTLYPGWFTNTKLVSM